MLSVLEDQLQKARYPSLGTFLTLWVIQTQVTFKRQIDLKKLFYRTILKPKIRGLKFYAGSQNLYKTN